jgi:tol-pal system protein YbgF
VDQKLTDQQSKIVAPVASLGSKVDQMSGDIGSVRETVTELAKRMAKMDAALTDISSTVRTLNTPVSPPAAQSPQATATTPGTSAPPAGMSAELSYQTALKDLKSGKDTLAFDEFRDYLKYFAQTENAPLAQYYIGEIYLNAKQYDDAVKSFDAVVDKFPENPKNADAIYMKAVALQRWGDHKTEAGREYKNLIKRYPDSPNVPNAHKHLRELGMEATAPKKRG